VVGLILVCFLLSGCANIVIRHDTAQDESHIFSMFKDILRNERPYLNADFEPIYFREFTREVEEGLYVRPPRRIAVFDINGDGVPEVIVEVMGCLVLVMHYYNGEVYGNVHGCRNMEIIFTDGTIFMSANMTNSFSIGELIINAASADILVAKHFDNVDGQDYHHITNERESITWYPFTQENIQNLAALITPRYIPSQ